MLYNIRTSGGTDPHRWNLASLASTFKYVVTFKILCTNKYLKHNRS